MCSTAEIISGHFLMTWQVLWVQTIIYAEFKINWVAWVCIFALAKKLRNKLASLSRLKGSLPLQLKKSTAYNVFWNRLKECHRQEQLTSNLIQFNRQNLSYSRKIFSCVIFCKVWNFSLLTFTLPSFHDITGISFYLVLNFEFKQLLILIPARLFRTPVK